MDGQIYFCAVYRSWDDILKFAATIQYNFV